MQKVRRCLLPIVFTVFALAIAAMGILSLYTNAYAVMIDGEEWGIIYNEADAETAVQNVQERVSEVLDEPYTLNSDVSCEKVFTLKSHVTGEPDVLEEDLYNNVPDITDGYVLRVDGETVGIGEKDDLEDLIDDVKEQYVNENTVSVKILSDVEIEYDTVSSDTDDDPDAIAETLTEVTEDEKTIEVSETKTVEEVSDEIDVSSEQILTLNPEIIEPDNEETDIDKDNTDEETVDTEDNDTIDETSSEDTENIDDIDDTENTADINDIEDTEDINDTDETDDTEQINISDIDPSEVTIEENTVITIEPEKALLVIETQDIETHEEEIEYETIEEEDDELPLGEIETITEGENGTAEVSETITKWNGKEKERTQSDYEIIEEPIDEVIAIGTKEPEPVIEPEVIVKNASNSNDMSSVTNNSDSVTNNDTSVVNNDTSETENITYHSNNYIWPLDNYGTGSISSYYGWRTIYGSGQFHNGIDIAAPGGTPIKASNDGIVITNCWNDARGWYVQIQHYDGYITTYQHMNAQSSVSLGQYVSQGEVIGYVGTTGDSTGNHLHFEVYDANRNIINPMTLFDGTNGISSYSVKTSAYDTDDDKYTAEEITYTDLSDESASLRNSIVEYAEQFLGCPYVHAGHGPDVFDCSGFTGYVYRHFGYEIYDSVECQLQYGTDVPIDVSQMLPGDLIFFDTTSAGKATHVGMYIGNGQYIHASSTYGQVIIDTVRSTASRPIVAVKRIM